MVVCCRPAASSIASLTARTEGGEPSTGAKIFIDKSESPMRRPRSDRGPIRAVPAKPASRGWAIELIFDALESLEPLKPHLPPLPAEQQRGC
jgi:hypothetical protein